MKEISLSEIAALGESVDFECKAAQGKDGSGELPLSFWETYSAMANTEGGEVYLGIEEVAPGNFNVKGIANTGKIKKTLWDTLHSRTKVNRNILTESDVQDVLVDGLPVVRVVLPRARRQDRPVHLSGNPFGNTYLRRHEGDYKAEDEIVRRMIAESVEDSRDDRILDNFGIEDLEKETISAYRNRFSAVKPDSPWIDLSAEEFLNKIGAIGKDRTTGKTGVRAAGLLMFGKYESIREVFPNYMVDYQERSEVKAEPRWVDRLVPDGTWSGNLYDYFQKVYRKLTSDVKVPFRLKEGVRTEDTPLHESIREALTNTIIHADFTGRASVLAVKRPDMFAFRNPGLMRVPLEQAVQGGISDCRNRRIQDMFRYVGLGDHAGSGIPKIYRNWKEQHWRLPRLYEDLDNELTRLELRMISLLPEESVKMLDELFGERFRALPELERIILITAAAEDSVNHTRIKEMSTEHPKDISAALAHLVQEEMLVKQGETRGSTYYVPGKTLLEDLSLFQTFGENSPKLEWSSLHLLKDSLHLQENSLHLPQESPNLQDKLTTILTSLDLSEMPRKIKSEIMRGIVLGICEGRYVSLRELASLLKRDSVALQNHYLTPMLWEGLLELKYPEIKNHPDQGYRKK